VTKVAYLLQSKGTDVYRIHRDAPVVEAARELLEKNVSSLVVYDDHQMVGIFTKNDLTRCCAAHPERVAEARVAEFMKSEIYTTTADADLHEVISTMIRRGFHHVPVHDGGKAIGMITSVDILTYESHRLQSEEEELLRYIRGSY
jgi:CBS domain-containing protein